MGRVFRRAAAVALTAAFGFGFAAPDARAADGGWYVGLNAPVMFIDDTVSTTAGMQALDPRLPARRGPYRANAASEHDTGFKLAGVLGYELGNGLRVEGELFLARAEVARLSYSGVTADGQAVPGGVNVPIAGTAEQIGGLANVWYDIRTGTEWMPYLGGGLGFIRVDQSDLKYDANRLVQAIAEKQARRLGQSAPQYPPGFVPEISTTDTIVVYHLGAGLGYRLTDDLVLQAGYRLQIGNDLRFEGSNRFGTVDVSTDMRIHFVEVGLRYRF